MLCSFIAPAVLIQACTICLSSCHQINNSYDSSLADLSSRRCKVYCDEIQYGNRSTRQTPSRHGTLYRWLFSSSTDFFLRFAWQRRASSRLRGDPPVWPCECFLYIALWMEKLPRGFFVIKAGKFNKRCIEAYWVDCPLIGSIRGVLPLNNERWCTSMSVLGKKLYW